MSGQQRRRGLFPLAIIFILALLLLGPAANRWQTRRERVQTYGVYTQAQVEARAATLCRALGGQPETLSITTTHTEGQLEHQGRAWMRWEVAYDDASEWTRYSFLWDAATGRLYSASVCYPTQVILSLPGRAHQPDAVLIHTAQRWLAQIGIAPGAREWGQASVSRYSALDRVIIKRPGEKAYLSLSKDGRLFLAAKLVRDPN